MGQSHWFSHPSVSDLRCVSLPFRLFGPAEILAGMVLNVVVIILRRRGEVPDDLGIKGVKEMESQDFRTFRLPSAAARALEQILSL